VTQGLPNVLDLLPHRYPFLLIDRILEASKERVVCVKHVSHGEPYFQGHFPGLPVMPGVLQLEAIAQAGAVLGGQIQPFDPVTEAVVLMMMDKVKFRNPVVPGDQLVITVTPLRVGRIFKFHGMCKVGENTVSEAEIVARTIPRSALALA